MGKRRHSHTLEDDVQDVDMDVESVEDTDGNESPRKKHKKSKHKKHKKSSDGHHSERHGDRHGERREHKKKKKEKRHREQEGEGAGGLKLKIKLGGHTVSTSSADNAAALQYTGDDDDETVSENEELFELDAELQKGDQKVEKEEDRDEEARWLHALEAGDLDESGQLKSQSHKPLTARQRSLKQEHVGFQEELVELPMQRKTKEVTEEVLARRSEMARKRRLKQQKEQEEIKKQTVKKLITKQTKKKDDEKEVVARRNAGPRIQFSSSANCVALSFAKGFDYPLAKQEAREPPKPVLCAADKCQNLKKYACSSNGLPVCSLACYKTVHDRPSNRDIMVKS